MAAGVVAWATLLEAVRNRLLLVAVFFAVVLVGLSVSAASVSIGEQSRLIVDVGLAAASALGSVIAIAVAISSFAGEIRRRTAYPVLARPLPRWAFVLGKYLGVLSALEAIVVIMVVATAGVVWLYGDPVPAALWWSLGLTMIEMALVVALATFFSTIASPVLAATYSVGVLLAGNLAGDIQALASQLEAKGKTLGPVLRWVYYVLPDLQRLSVRSQAANNLPVPGDFVVYGVAYGLCYAAVMLVLAMWVFSRRRVL
jgi:ABC-type transport system involved in multi-copper enzyme maturation permease subunit